MYRPGFRVQSFSLSLIIASMVLGFLLTAQFRSPAARIPTHEQSRLVTAGTVQHLEAEQRDLKQQIADLRTAVAAAQKTNDNAQAHSSVAVIDLESQRQAAGLTALHGPGVIAVLDDSSKAMASNDDANNYIVHDYELRDVVNLLWMTNAEAIAINGERLVNLSSLYCVGSTILVNDTRLSPPYEVRAIGESVALEESLQNPKNLTQLRTKARLYGVQFKVNGAKDVVVPAYNANLSIRYAQPTEAGRRQLEVLRGGGN